MPKTRYTDNTFATNPPGGKHHDVRIDETDLLPPRPAKKAAKAPARKATTRKAAARPVASRKSTTARKAAVKKKPAAKKKARR
jgi:topoisomerase IA-like protein